jgi:hypothetical protein
MASILTAVGIFITFGIAVANLWHSYTNNKKTGFINTVTSSRIEWINSLRDKVSTFIAVTTRLTGPELMETLEPEDKAANDKRIIDLMRERDTFMHQIILHLNPEDPEDQAIKKCVTEILTETKNALPTQQIATLLTQLRDATANYLKKEWEKVKDESEKGRLTKSKNE